MNILQKTATALIASISLVTAVSSASAQTVSPGGPVTASGQLTLSVLGNPSIDPTVCQFTFTGTATATGFVFTSYTGTAVSGDFYFCDDTISLDDGGLVIDAVSPTELNLERILLNTRWGGCGDMNVPLSWNNSNIVINKTLTPICVVSGTLTVSPTQTISN